VVDGYLQWDTDHESTCTQLSALSVFGSPVDITEEYVESEDVTYAFMFNRSTSPGAGMVTMVFAKPVAASMNTTLDAPAGCGLRELTADLSAITPVYVPFEARWLVDFSNLTRDGQGRAISLPSIDRLSLSFLVGVTLDEIEEQILGPDRIATEHYELDLSGGQTAFLSAAQNRETGEAFSSFRRNEEGIWILSLACSVCFDSTPLFVTVLDSIQGR
jgi:hypothetical protein